MSLDRKHYQPKALVILDFDQTLSEKHTFPVLATKFSQIENYGKKNLVSPSLDVQAKQWDLIKDFHPRNTGNKKDWKAIITELLQEKHEVAVASFTSFSHLIPKYLKEKIGLTEGQVKQIHVSGWLPTDPRIADKNTHIKDLIDEYKAENKCFTPNQIILVDDSVANVNQAIRVGYQGIHVAPHDNNIDIYLQLQSALKNSQTQSITLETKQSPQPGSKR